VAFKLEVICVLLPLLALLFFCAVLCVGFVTQCLVKKNVGMFLKMKMVEADVMRKEGKRVSILFLLLFNTRCI
jgi:hypothetical protein